jgi:hypothetical protein
VSTALAVTPAYLPEGRPLGLVQVDDTWNAVTVPASWGRQVLDILGIHSGPVMEDQPDGRLLWVIEAGGADSWPDATAAGVEVHRAGAELLMCALDGYRCGMRWLKVPTRQRWTTDAELLRLAVEFVVGPLAEAQPIALCLWCAAPTRHGHLLGRYQSDAGAGGELYACEPCHRATAQGGTGRHLRVVRQGPL